MTTWRIDAVRADGEPVELRVRAPDSEAAVERIRSRGLLVGGVGPVPGTETGQRVPWGRAGRDPVSEFLRELGTLLEAGLSIVVALGVLEDHGFSRRLSAIAASLSEVVRSGGELSTAMARFPVEFDLAVRQAVAAGERSGTLPAVLVRLAEDRLKMSERRRRLLTALVNPVITVLVAFAVVWILSTFLLPKLLVVYQRLQIDLPDPTRRVLAVFGNLREHAVHYALAAGTAWGLLRLAVRRRGPRRVWHRFVLALPIVGKVARWSAYSIAFRTFGMLYRAGVGLLGTLEHARDVSTNQVVAEEFESLLEGVRAGEPLSKSARDRRLFDAFCRSMIETGERSGALDSSLDKIARKFDGSLDHLFARIEATFTPALTIALLIVVGYVVYALYLPFVTLIQALSAR